MPDVYVLPFSDPRAASVPLTGGKGASLARLATAGYPVPNGAVVSSTAYRTFIEGWPEFVEMVGRLPVTGSPDDLRTACADLRTSFLARPLPEEIEAALRSALASVVGQGSVSVRSSATLEDLVGAAFAGQHDTFLDVDGLDAVIEHVPRCWASLWEDRAVRYRDEKGFGLLDADMAVVVQRMIPAVVAGVAFSIHPVTGETDQILVTGAWGLGETVVAGEGEIDQWVVAKKEGAVLDEQLGTKHHQIVRAADGGTETVEVAPERQDVPCLTRDHLAALGRLVVAVERHHGFPQDVEWAMDLDGQLHLLQSRPVTELPARWTRQESAERFPNPITPLTWSFTTPGFHESLAYSLDLMGLPPYEGEWFTRLDGYIYGNQTAIEVFTAGHAAAFDSLDELVARVPMFRDRYRWVQELPVQWARDLDWYLLELGRLGNVRLDDLKSAELWAHALDIDRLGREYFRPNIAISITQGLLHRLLFQFVAHVVGPPAAPGVYDGLTSFCETKTGLVNRDLRALAALAHVDEALARLLTERPRREIIESGALEAHPGFAGALERFLAVHGHREVDFDAYHPTWSGQPWVVLENIRLMLNQVPGEDPGAGDHARRFRQHEAEQAFLSRVPAELRVFAGEIVRLARTYTALDDLEHYQTTRLTPPFRATLVELGRRLVVLGALAEPEDVFFLDRETLARVVQGEIDAVPARQEADAAKDAYRKHLATEPTFQYGVSEDANVDGQIRGLPGSPGEGEGPVCFVHSAEDFASFQPGSVLVARTTNPAWTPLFYSAVAVITESGGPLSHGAVTAREVGIPAVMRVRGALGQLLPGQRVRVNGTTGVVTVIDG